MRVTGDGRVQEALDQCIARLRRGESLEHCLADYPDLDAELRSLLAIAAELGRSAPASLPDGLSRARARFLAAASEARVGRGVTGQANGEDPIAVELLDRCLERLQAGMPLDQILAGQQDRGAELAGLLEVAAAVQAQRLIPPAPPAGLARGRARFLAAAHGLGVASIADAAAVATTAAEADLLESCLAGLTRGEALEAVLVDHPAEAVWLRPLLSMAATAAATAVAPPPPRQALATGRQRFLNVAAQRAARRVAAPAAGGGEAEPGSVRALLLGWLRPGGRVAAGRVAAMLAGLVLFLLVGQAAIAPVAAEAIPGDALYPMKQLGESMRLLSTVFDAAGRQRVLAELSAERAREIELLMLAGREEELDWTVYLRGSSDDTAPGEDPHGTLRVALLKEEGTPGEERTLSWDRKTRFDLDGYEHIGLVPADSLIQVRVLTLGGGGAGPALPLAKRVQLMAKLEPTATVTATATLTGSESTPVGTEDPTTGTPVPATEPPPTETPAATGTEEPSPTATIEPPPPTATPMESKRQRNTEILRGFVESKDEGADTWLVRRVPAGDDGGAGKVTVDVGRLGAAEKAGVDVGYQVEVEGRWKGPEKATFMAERLLGAAPCALDYRMGQVESVTPTEAGGIGRLTLGSGEEFDLSPLPPAAVQGVVPGAQVTVYFRDCGTGQRVVERVEVTSAPSTPQLRPYEGEVAAVDGNRFTLVESGSQRALTVEVDGSTVIGPPGVIRVGQVVFVEAWSDAEGILHAVQIDIVVDVATPTPPSDSPPPTPGTAGGGPSQPPLEPPVIPAARLTSRG
jgi:hypothetical protein